MKLKTWVTVYVYSDEPCVKIVQHKTKEDAKDHIWDFARAAYEYNPKAFYSEPSEEYNDLFFINETDYLEIRCLELDTTIGVMS